MLGLYEKGSQGKGNRKVFFGDSPTGKVVRKGEYVRRRLLAGLREAPGRLAGRRARQALAGHEHGRRQLVAGDDRPRVEQRRLADARPGQRHPRRAVVTTHYNDFGNLRWLGNKPAAKTQLYTDELGRWVCVEARAKLNTPGKKDGVNQLWIDGRLEAERTNLDWRGSYTKHGINAVFLETYWNKGSPVEQRRWLDNFVISTKPIGPVVASRTPTLFINPVGDKPRRCKSNWPPTPTGSKSSGGRSRRAM